MSGRIGRLSVGDRSRIEAQVRSGDRGFVGVDAGVEERGVVGHDVVVGLGAGALAGARLPDRTVSAAGARVRGAPTP